MTFEFSLTEEKIKPHQVTALHLLSAFTFCGTGAIFYFLFPATHWLGTGLLIAGVLLLGITLFKNKWLVNPGTNRLFRILELMILLCLASFTITKQWWVPSTMFGILSLTLLFGLYWEKSVSASLLVHIDEEGIKLPFPSRKRFIAWPDVDRVLLRFGTLTIDCYDNRLFQWHIQPVSFEEPTFISFCDKQITDNKHKKQIDDW